MGIFSRLHGTRRSRDTPQATAQAAWRIHPGDEDLEVVGEATYQDALWTLCGGSVGDRIRHGVLAVLVPEPDNVYDPNAISVRIEGRPVGYLRRQVAAQYISGLHRLMSQSGGYVALRGVIVGGGFYDDGPGRLGVWLAHNPEDFGVVAARSAPDSVPVGADGSMRTGLSEALRTDLADDSYDLVWVSDLPAADRPAIAMLRALLQQESSPIARHFQFAELEARLYHARDLYDDALNEFDDVCRQHDADMDTIRDAFIAKWGKIPLLETYRQMAIRQQKKRDWSACVWWTERGLALYGSAAAREDAVEDLLKRRNRAVAKLAGSPSVTQEASETESKPAPTSVDSPVIETLPCVNCQRSFERQRTRGRKPLLCPDCR